MENPAPPVDAAAGPTSDQRRFMRLAIIAQAFGIPAIIAFDNGIMLVYLHDLGLERSVLLSALSAPALGQCLLLLACAWFAARRSKRRTIAAGLLLAACGLAAIAAASLLPAGPARVWLVLAGALVFAVGETAFMAVWFAFMDPVVPPAVRGRFWGRLRFTWQSVSILLTAGCAGLVAWVAASWVYPAVIWLLTGAIFAQMALLLRVPEMETARAAVAGLRATLSRVVAQPGLLSFGAYLFLIYLFTMGAPALFGLIEKQVLRLADNQVIWLGNLIMVGSVLGSLLAGPVIDRRGTRPIFLYGHFGFAAILFAFLLRGLWPESLLPFVLAGLHLAFGLTYAAVSIAVTTQTLALAPLENKAFAISFVVTLYQAGHALSKNLCAGVLKLGLLSEEWSFSGLNFSAYDALLLAGGLMVLLLVVTLGLVPGVLRKAEWLPYR